MRWEQYFADLEGQAAALAALERDAEIADRTRSEAGRLSVVDRLGAAVGLRIELHCDGGLRVTGRVGRLHPQWLLIDEGGGREVVVSVSQILSVAGLSRSSAPPDGMSAVASRFDLSLALRGLARDRSALRLHLVDGMIRDGTLDRVGRDWVELAEHPLDEPRRPAQVRRHLLIALRAIVAVRRTG